MNRSIVFYLVSRLALINGLALLIPLLAALWWGKRAWSILPRPWPPPCLQRRSAVTAAAITNATWDRGRGPGTWYRPGSSWAFWV